MPEKTTIILKKDNFPKEPGDYLCQRYADEMPQLARVYADPRQEGELCMEYFISKFPVTQCEPHALFSDKLTIETPAFEEASPE